MLTILQPKTQPFGLSLSVKPRALPALLGLTAPTAPVRPTAQTPPDARVATTALAAIHGFTTFGLAECACL